MTVLDLSFDTVGLALGAGLVAAVNPCGFALLPVYLSMFVLEEHAQRGAAVGRALRATVLLAAVALWRRRIHQASGATPQDQTSPEKGAPPRRIAHENASNLERHGGR